MNVSSTPVGLLSPQQLADHLGLPLQTIYQWASEGKGPRRYRVGRHSRYKLSDVDAWLAENEISG